MRCPMCGLVFDDNFGVCRDCGWIVPQNNSFKPENFVNRNAPVKQPEKSGSYRQQQNFAGSGVVQPPPVRNNGGNADDKLEIILPCVIAAVVVIIIAIIAVVFIGGKDDDNKSVETSKDSVVYTAEELASKSLDEIVELMDYDFEISTSGEKLVWYTSPTVYIYNYDELPGFVFYIDEAYDDWNYDDENLADVKDNIIDGEYDEYSFIAVFDDAKLDDDISADMDYIELTDYWGNFDGSWANDVTYSPNEDCTVLFPADCFEDMDYVETISADVMEEYNPDIKSIIVYPDFEAEYDEVDEVTSEHTTLEETTTEKESTTQIETTTQKATTTKKETTTKAETTTEKTTSKKPSKGTSNKKLIFASMPDHFTFTSGAGAWCTGFELEDDGSFTGEYTDSNMDEVYICNFTGKFTEPKKIDKYTYVMELDYLDYERPVGEVYYENGIKYITSDAYGFDNPDKFYIYLPGKPKSETPTGFLSWSFIDEDLDCLPRFFYGIYNEGGKEGFTGLEDDNVWHKYYVCELENGNISELNLSYSGNSFLTLTDADGSYIDSLCLGPYSLFESEAELGECIVTSRTGDTYGVSWKFTSGYDEVTVKVHNYSGNGLKDWGVKKGNTFEEVHIG